MLPSLDDSCAHMNQSSTLGCFFFLPLRPRSMLETEPLQLEGALHQGQMMCYSIPLRVHTSTHCGCFSYC